MTLTVRVGRVEGGTAAVEVCGELDLATTAWFSAGLLSLLDQGIVRMELQVSALSFCDVTGARALGALAQLAHEQGGEVVLTGGDLRLHRVLDLVWPGQFPQLPTVRQHRIVLRSLPHARPAPPLEPDRRTAIVRRSRRLVGEAAVHLATMRERGAETCAGLAELHDGLARLHEALPHTPLTCDASSHQSLAKQVREQSATFCGP